MNQGGGLPGNSPVSAQTSDGVARYADPPGESPIGKEGVMWLPKLAFPGDGVQATVICDPAPCRRRLPAVLIAVALPVAVLAGCSSSAPVNAQGAVNTQGAQILHLTIDSRLVHGAMPLTLVTPAGGGAHRPLLVFLHGLHSAGYDNNSQLTDQMFAALHALGPRAPDIAFPYGDDSYWVNSASGAWTSYVLDEVIPKALTVLHADPRRVRSAASRWAATAPTKAAAFRAVSWAKAPGVADVILLPDGLM